jgi:hypothetical protein
MDRIPTARATLDIETEGRAPTGTLISADGVARRFTGWTEFAAVIQDWRAAQAGAGTTNPHLLGQPEAQDVTPPGRP